VASFCAKCGAELTPDKQFCTACGTPVAAPVAVVAQAQPAAVPPKSGTSALKIILIILAVFVGLGILGAGAFGFMVWRIARSVHVSGPNGQVTMNTPGGTITANSNESFTASELGIDIYPGAQPGKGSMRMIIAGSSVVHGIFVTSDSKDQVYNYYKGKLGSDSFEMNNGNSAVLSVNKPNKESIMITITANSGQNDGKTQISIMHSISNKPS